MTPGTSTLLLSDFHAGHGRTHRERKRRALDAIATMARERVVGDVVLAGDIADERANRESVREDCAALRDAIEGFPSVFLRGNHDDAAYFDAAEMEELLRCRIDERPWHVSPVSGVAVTHGHHFRTRVMRTALKDAADAGDLDALFSTNKAQRRQRRMTKGFSAAGRIGNALGTAGIPATELWERLHHATLRSRGRMAVALRRRKQPSTVRALRERVADMIDVRGVRHAARLARTLRSWGAVSGHTHVPGLYRHVIDDDLTGEPVPFLVGNCGGFVSRYAPTFIEARYPCMILWQYDAQKHAMIERQRMELSAADMQAQERFFRCG